MLKPLRGESKKERSLTSQEAIQKLRSTGEKLEKKGEFLEKKIHTESAMARKCALQDKRSEL